LNLDDDAFQALPIADDALGPNDPPSSLARIEHRAWQAVRPIEKLWSRLGRQGGSSA
jgi:hypothetical protein